MIGLLWRHWAGQLLMWVALGSVLAGCAPTFKGPGGGGDVTLGQRLGFLPDAPAVSDGKGDACSEFQTYARYAVQLEEAYRVRTTQNRAWIYVAGLTGLAVAAASGALAIGAAVAAGTLGLLAVSGGFTAGAFATINNTELSTVYNVAASEIGSAVASARTQVSASPANCAIAYANLVQAVSQARNKLELARTNSAAGALVRAQAAQKDLENIIRTQREGDVGQVTLTGEIAKIDNGSEVCVTKDQEVTLTVVNVQLDRAIPSEIKIGLGPLPLLNMATPFPNPVAANTYEVKVLVPRIPPDATREYRPFLAVGTGPRIAAKPGLLLRYPAVTFTIPRQMLPPIVFPRPTPGMAPPPLLVDVTNGCAALAAATAKVEPLPGTPPGAFVLTGPAGASSTVSLGSFTPGQHKAQVLVLNFTPPGTESYAATLTVDDKNLPAPVVIEIRGSGS